MHSYLRGLKAGVPIGIGYLSVSFGLGILAVSLGFYVWQAVLISMLTLTSAGQLSGIHTMCIPGQYAEMLISQLTINVRYSFMSVCLSQKTDAKFQGVYRWLLGFFMTDEIFAVASTEKSVSRSFFFGLTAAPFFGWTLGTLLGALLGDVLPERVMNALCIAIYAMFVAIVIPQVRTEKNLALPVLVSVLLSTAFYYLPVLNTVSSGISMTVCAVAAAVLGALVFPVRNEEEESVNAQ
ncbi:MAG: AzlC family ABC transporter permease [Clostridia bacterium]|nr:AzlC family ABC transporter permease [Clostridia bacterium]